jgi:hypothetical protein
MSFALCKNYFEFEANQCCEQQSEDKHKKSYKAFQNVSDFVPDLDEDEIWINLHLV